MRCYWQGKYRTTELEFDPLHKGDWIARSLLDDPINLVGLTAAPLADKDRILLAHDLQYIDALITGQPEHLATTAGLGWEPQVWPSLLASAGGALAAVNDSLRTGSAMSLSSGAHHALFDRGRGMCFINDLAIAVKHYPDKRVLVLDFDAHGGGGTKSLIEDLPLAFQADVATSIFDRTYTGGNFYAHLCRQTDDYLDQILNALKWATNVAKPELILYNAGMDVHQDSEQNAKRGITTEILAAREKIVADWAMNFKIPIAGFLSGGYISDTLTTEDLIYLHRLTIENLVRCQWT